MDASESRLILLERARGVCPARSTTFRKRAWVITVLTMCLLAPWASGCGYNKLLN